MAYEFRAKHGLITPVVTSTVSTGTAPLTVASTTAVTNLNADLLDGQHGSYYYSPSNPPSSGAVWSKKVAAYTAVSGDMIIADTSGGTFTITLPAGPSVGASVVFADGADWYTTNLTIGRNSSTIEGVAEDLVLNIKGIQVTLLYDGSTWEVFAATGPAELPVQTGNSGKYLTTNGTTPTWATINAGASITNDTSTNSTYYPLWATATSGLPTVIYTSSTKFQFNPSTGTLSTTNYDSLSDISLKYNVNSLQNSYNIISKIRPVSFNWKDTDDKAYGFIAQEVEAILPDIVHTDISTGIKSMSYIQLIPLLVNSLIELKAEVDALKEERKQ